MKIDELDQLAGGEGLSFAADSFDRLIEGDFVDNLIEKTRKIGLCVI